MPLLNTLATPYADALLQVGESRKESDALAEEAKVIAEQKAAIEAAGFNPADCDVSANASNNGYIIKNCTMQP